MGMGGQRLAVVGLSLLVVVFALAGRFVEGEAQREQTYEDLATFTEVLHLVNSSYVDPVADEQLMVGAFRGMLANLDAHSGWLSPEEVASLNDDKATRLGIGIETTKRGGYAYVVAVRATSPAARAGVKVGEYIRTINGRSSREMSVFQTRRALGGAPGTSLTLNLFGDGQGRDVEMKLEAFKSMPITATQQPGGVLLLQVHYLEAETVQAVGAALAKPPAGTTQVLLDLRNTVAGRREDGTALADLFLDAGTIVRIDQRGQDEVSVTASPEVIWSGPVALLVNRLSGGPVEIAVAALKENGRARVLGEPTLGDASLQQLIRLPDASAVILSVGRYLPPTGASWSGAGIEPDVAISRNGATETEAGEAAAGEVATGEPEANDAASPAADDAGDGQLERALEFLLKGQAEQKTAA